MFIKTKIQFFLAKYDNRGSGTFFRFPPLAAHLSVPFLIMYQWYQCTQESCKNQKVKPQNNPTLSYKALVYTETKSNNKDCADQVLNLSMLKGLYILGGPIFKKSSQNFAPDLLISLYIYAKLKYLKFYRFPVCF